MVRFGVIGAGRIAATFAAALNATEGHGYAIASRSSEKANAFKEKHGFDVAYGSYAEMVTDPLVDCVYVATPHAFHKVHMMMAIDHGKHVLCEKAFTLNADEAEEVFARAKETGVFVMEAMWSRFLPAVRAIISSVERGIIGNPLRLEVDFSFRGDEADQRLYEPSLGGGALLDIGVYAITFANLFFGRPETIESTATKADSGVDIDARIMYRYPSAQAIMQIGFTETRPIEATLYGSEGKIHMPLFWQMEKAFHYSKDGKLVDVFHHPHRVNGFEYQIDEVIRCLQDGRRESDTMPHETTLEILRQMDALRAMWGVRYRGE